MAAYEQRLATLEAAVTQGAAVSRDAGGAESVMSPPPHASTAFETGLVLPLIGRTFIVFGGAFLLRALTDGGQLPLVAGVSLGLLYAIACVVAAGRAAASGRRLSAMFHGVAGVSIGLPVIWEASTGFKLFAPAVGVAMVAMFVGFALVVAWYRRIQSLAGTATVGGIVILCALVIATGAIAPATLALILLGFATLWLGYDCDWHWMRWPAGLMADLAVLEIATRAMRPNNPEAPGVVIALQLLLLGGYLAIIASRTLVKGRLVIPFEVIQTLGVLLVGLGGAVAVAHRVGTGEVALGIAGVALGAGSYGAAFAFVGRRQGLGENFYFYATLGLVLTLTGLAVVLPRLELVMAFSVLAVLTAWLAARFARLALVLHSAVYGTMAAGVSGLLANAAVAFVGSPASSWPLLGLPGWVALAAVGLCIAVPRPTLDGSPRLVTRGPRTVLALLLVAGCGAAVMAAVAPAIAGVPPEPGVLATVRTAVLAAAAIVLAVATRHERLAELGGLLYPVLALGGLKLVMEDFRYSHAGTLFVALALFGVALVAAPRLARRIA